MNSDVSFARSPLHRVFDKHMSQLSFCPDGDGSDGDSDADAPKHGETHVDGSHLHGDDAAIIKLITETMDGDGDLDVEPLVEAARKLSFFELFCNHIRKELLQEDDPEGADQWKFGDAGNGDPEADLRDVCDFAKNLKTSGMQTEQPAAAAAAAACTLLDAVRQRQEQAQQEQGQQEPPQHGQHMFTQTAVGAETQPVEPEQNAQGNSGSMQPTVEVAQRADLLAIEDIPTATAPAEEPKEIHQETQQTQQTQDVTLQNTETAAAQEQSVERMGSQPDGEEPPKPLAKTTAQPNGWHSKAKDAMASERGARTKAMSRKPDAPAEQGEQVQEDDENDTKKTKKEKKEKHDKAKEKAKEKHDTKKKEKSSEKPKKSKAAAASADADTTKGSRSRGKVQVDALSPNSKRKAA